MTRRISVYALVKNGPICLDWYIAELGLFKRVPFDKGDGLTVHGCGMDMGFHLVYETSRILYPEGCSDIRENRKDGGYQIHHEWL